MQNEELRLSQTALDAARARYFDLYELAPVGYCTVNQHGIILEANLTASTMFGNSREALIKQPLSKFIFKDDQDIYYIYLRLLFKQDRKELWKARKSEPCELRMQKKEGIPFWVHLNAVSIQDADDELICCVTISDITIYKEAEETEKKRQKAETDLAEVKIAADLLSVEKEYLQDEIKLESNHEEIIGQSDALKYVLYKIEQIAELDTIVLVMGETGTGKELVARAIHSLSLRKQRAMVKVNCAALSATVIESELFGHEKGSFTGSYSKHLGRFEVAHGSTLFLDEIGELSLELQSKLLRVLQDGEFERLGSSRTIKVDTRVIVATNRRLEDEVKKGRFREDLWYRINVFPITMPPLRDRNEDIPLLVDFYIKKIARRVGRDISIIPQEVMDTLQSYHWPGNIRELQNVLERGVINSSGQKLHLVDTLVGLGGELTRRSSDKEIKTLEEVERDYIVQILEKTDWKVSGKNSANEILGLNRSTLRARMRKLGIEKNIDL
ncbi:MAG: sigma 54-interacting transcriptional regulator [Desulfamplus sp.]|nr:sigma 54-interacting transcriptional regulator [Desulfamplus sp.]